MSIRAVVYSSPHEDGQFIAHCLELDVIGSDASVEGAIEHMMEAVETQVDVHRREYTQLFFPAPPAVWQKYNQAERARRRIPEELLLRVCERANKRLQYGSPSELFDRLDNVVGTAEALACV